MLRQHSVSCADGRCEGASPNLHHIPSITENVTDNNLVSPMKEFFFLRDEYIFENHVSFTGFSHLLFMLISPLIVL